MKRNKQNKIKSIGWFRNGSSIFARSFSFVIFRHLELTCSKGRLFALQKTLKGSKNEISFHFHGWISERRMHLTLSWKHGKRSRPTPRDFDCRIADSLVKLLEICGQFLPTTRKRPQR
jgi:hypothetical protein